MRRSLALGRSDVALAVGGYAAIALLMVLLWMTLPLVALVLFLAVASVHFGEDWQMLEEPLLRFAAGAAVIAAATIGHPAEVSALFVAMSDPRAAVIAQIITAAAPVALLVTAVGIAVAWRDGSRHWAAAMALCFALLLVLPPVAGFALFFVFLHSPRHLAQTRARVARHAARAMARHRRAAVGPRHSRLVGGTIASAVELRADIRGTSVSAPGIGRGAAFAALALARSAAVRRCFL